MTGTRAGARRARRRGGPSLPRPGSSGGAALLAAAMVVVATILVLVTPSEPGAAPRPVAARGAAVTETTLACPLLRSPPTGVRTSYGVALAHAGTDGAEGRVTAEPGGALSLDRGAAVPVEATSRSGLVVRGERGSAPGLLAWRADTGSSTAVLDCPAPRASWWFTGAGAALDHDSRVVLRNLDTGPAVVDLRVLSPDGDVDVTETGGKGIEVPPGGTVTLPLVDLAPQTEELSVWVHATRGRVTAAVSDRFAESPSAEPGYEWVPAQTGPSRVVRLAGVPVRAGSRTLLVANPSRLESLVTVEVAGPTGRFVPADIGDLSVAPGTVRPVDLSAVLRGEPFAVRLRGTRPVVAAMRSVHPAGDITYAGAARPLTGPAALPVVGRSSVQVTAGNSTTRTVVTAYAEDGAEVGSTRLSLAALATGSWPVPDGSAYVVLEPAQGRSSAAMVYSGASALPFQDLPMTVRLPVVQPAG